MVTRGILKGSERQNLYRKMNILGKESEGAIAPVSQPQVVHEQEVDREGILALNWHDRWIFRLFK